MSCRAYIAYGYVRNLKKKERKENDVKIETKDQKERDDQKSICVREQMKKKMNKKSETLRLWKSLSCVPIQRRRCYESAPPK